MYVFSNLSVLAVSKSILGPGLSNFKAQIKVSKLIKSKCALLYIKHDTS